MSFSATYSPEDNKLRLRASARLDRDLYDRVRKAGFIWAPKQDLFVAPMWTPERADLLIELCGEIDDEDTSLVDRAEERAERFAGYSEARAEDAEEARARVEQITDGIPMGQPILVGHHSEKHARKDAERIQNGQRRVLKMWETSRYWEQRAKGAIRHAKYKEIPAVRHRRIKGLESDKRREEKRRSESAFYLKLWRSEELTLEKARKIASVDRGCMGTWTGLGDGTVSIAEASERAVKAHERLAEHADRWIAHIDNRIAYERAMLDEGGGIKAERFAIEVGGRVLIRGEWLVVVRVNKVGGAISSVSVTGGRFRGAYVAGIETVADYREPDPGDVEKVKARAKARLAPIVNVPGEGFREMTKAEWDECLKYGSGSMQVAKATATRGAYRYRQTFKPGGSFQTVQVYLTDAKRADYPPPETTPAEPVVFERKLADPRDTPRAPAPVSRAEAEIEAARAAVKTGVQVAVADQLFPTPPEVVERMIALAELEPGHAVLEPSAGTGNITKALADAGVENVTAVEIDPRLAKALGARCADFLALNGEIGKFDRVLMNPPFKAGADIEHILHARSKLRPGGRLVAICAGGPRQEAKLRPLSETWEELPAGTFRTTGVRTILLTMRAPTAPDPDSYCIDCKTPSDACACEAAS